LGSPSWGWTTFPGQGYYRAKVAQEKQVQAARVPYSIIRATQFLEFLGPIADANTDGNIVTLPEGLLQPIAADDVAAIIAEVALAAPRNETIDVAGPERAPFAEIIDRYLKAIGDPREAVTSSDARYFGGRIEEKTLVPLGPAHLGRTTMKEWLDRSQTGA